MTTVQLWVETGVLPAWKTAGGHRRIPRKAVEDLVAKQAAAIDTQSEPAGSEPTESTVLIVEDNPVERELYRLRFTEWQLPIRLILAENGFEGLVLAGRYSPDLVIADLSMPGMDGFKMIHELYRQSANIPSVIIVVTGLTAEEIESRGGLPPELPIYPKPIPFAALRPVIQHHAIVKKTAIQRAHLV